MGTHRPIQSPFKKKKSIVGGISMGTLYLFQQRWQQEIGGLRNTIRCCLPGTLQNKGTACLFYSAIPFCSQIKLSFRYNSTPTNKYSAASTEESKF